jgi:integrase/recombinase XerD
MMLRNGSAHSVALLHTGLRIDEALSRDVEHLTYHRGHRILRLARKGGRGDKTVLTGPVSRALDDYLDGRAARRATAGTNRGRVIRRNGGEVAFRLVGLRKATSAAPRAMPHDPASNPSAR